MGTHLLVQVRRNATTTNAEDVDAKRAYNLRVHYTRTVCLWQTQPEEKYRFQKPPEWNPVQDERRPEFQNSKNCIDNPVSEVLGVIPLSWGL